MNFLKYSLFSVLLLSTHAIANMHHITEDDDNHDCHRYPMNVVQVWLKNSKIIDISNLNFDKTMGEKLSSEKIRRNLWNNIFHFVFVDNNNNSYEIITRNIASNEECSISDVEIYMISKGNNKHVGDYKQYY